MPPSTLTQVETLLLDADHAVERDAAVGDQRAAGLDSRRLPGAELLARRADERADVVLDRRRILVGGVGDAEAAAEVVDRELAERARSRRSPRGTARARCSCEPMWKCSPRSSRPPTAAHALDRARRVGEADAELRVGLAGRDLLVRVAARRRA